MRGEDKKKTIRALPLATTNSSDCPNECRSQTVTIYIVSYFLGSDNDLCFTVVTITFSQYLQVLI